MTKPQYFSFIENVISTIDDFSKESEKYIYLCEDVNRIIRSIKSKSTTKQVLLLRKYGSKKELKMFSNDIYKELLNIIKKLEININDLKNFLKIKNIKCLNCYGIGSKLKAIYQREKGQPTQRIMVSKKCVHCDGKGFISFDINPIQEQMLYNIINVIIVFQDILKKYIDIINKMIQTNI